MLSAFILLVGFGYTTNIAKTVPNSTENDTIFKVEVFRDAAIAIAQFGSISESEIALVVAVSFLIIGNEDVLVATEFLLCFDGLCNELVNREREIYSIHISWFLLVTSLYIAKTVPN
jgi:hypothetical protein